MKKIIVFALALLLSAPAAADWKDGFVADTAALMHESIQAMSKHGDLTPEMRKGILRSIDLTVFNAMSGMCIGFTKETGEPTPPESIDEILRVHTLLLRGEDLKEGVALNIGKVCLGHMEASFRKQGLNDADIKKVGAAIRKQLLPKMRAAMGLPPKQ